MKTRGQLIVVEGLDGAGKSTAIESIKQFLASQGIHVVLTREPGGTAVGEELRAIIKEHRHDEPLDPLCELLIMYAARVQLIKQVILPALARGDWVLADRNELSSYAYQGGGRGIPTADIDGLSRLCVADCKPDLLLFMDIDPKQGLERIKARGELDRMDQESLLFFENVHQAYHQAIAGKKEVRVIDASLPLVAVHDAILRALTQFCQQACHV